MSKYEFKKMKRKEFKDYVVEEWENVRGAAYYAGKDGKKEFKTEKRMAHYFTKTGVLREREVIRVTRVK